jgi:hypothetical protein
MKNEFLIKDEENLLLKLCRLEFSGDNLKKIKSLVPVIKDWNYFKNLANAHGVAALVSHNLDNLHLLTEIPEDSAGFLRSALMKSLSRNTFNTEITGEVLRLLNRENIKTVILKGLALENSVYGNAGLRQMTDVDVLINREECLRARKILISNGFASLPVKSSFHKMIIAYYGKHLPSLFKNGASVEIHYELFGGINNELTAILNDTSYKTEIRGEVAWFPQPQIFFLYLVKHLHSHEISNESQLRLYTDLVVLLEKYYNEILNNDLLKYAVESGMSEILATHLKTLRDMWGIFFPGYFDAFIDKWADRDSISKFIFFLESPKDNPRINQAGFYRHIIKDIPGLHRKFLFVLGDLFPSVSFMKDRYKCNSTLKVMFYYPHRLGKLIWLIKR